MQTAPETELLQAAEREGVLALLEWRLRSGEDWEGVSASLRESLEEGARAAAARWLLRRRELEQLAALLERGGIRALLLKGSALAFWLYPQPHLRMGGDIDLLFESRPESERAVHALSDLGYELAFMPGRTHYEMTCRRIVDGVIRSELDIHCKLVNAPAYAEVLTFDELWEAGMSLDGLGPTIRGLAMPHALLHACMNRALDLQNGIPDQLKLLYDLRLFCERMVTEDWRAFVSLVESKGMCGVALHSLGAACEVLRAAVPDQTLSRIRARAGSEALDYRRLGDWRYMQWRHLTALPTWRLRMIWIVERLFPARGQLQELHGRGSWWAQIWRRLRHAVTRLH